MATLIEVLDAIEDEIKQAGREIYYAMSFLESDHPAMANLKQALRALGIQSPRDVGLSISVLRKDDKEFN